MNRWILTLLSFWLVACGGPAFTALEVPAIDSLDASGLEAEAGDGRDAREVLVDGGDAADLVEAGDRREASVAAPDAQPAMRDGGSPVEADAGVLDAGDLADVGHSPSCSPAACATCVPPRVACCSNAGACGCSFMGSPCQ